MAAAAARTHEITTKTTQPLNNGTSLVWLDDTAEDDPNVKTVLSTLFDNIFVFTDPEACLELVESIQTKKACLSILISGKYGQNLVRERLQPLDQVKDIYVFCFDTVKHGRWAQTCDKVRCVFSDINKIIQCMEYDVQKVTEQQPSPPIDDEDVQVQVQEQQHPVEPKEQERERYTDDHNLFDQLALNLLLESPDDGLEDFNHYCRTHMKKTSNDENATDEEDQVEIEEKYFNRKHSIEEWYRPDLHFTQINSNDLKQLWTLRWFIRLFHRQLTNEHKKFVQDIAKFTVYYGTWLTPDELDGMKHRISQIIIITELLLTYAKRETALESIINNKENHKHKVIFEIKIDPNLRHTVPYTAVKNDEVLLWFGARYRVSKIEYIEEIDEQESPYWIIGLNLYPTLDHKASFVTLYDYYFKELTDLNNIHHAFGRIFMYKGYYFQAEKWLKIDKQYLELTELALRESHYNRAQEYLENCTEDSDDANLLRAYLNILTSSDNFSKARSILMKIFSESTDKLIRAKANIAFGFINLILTQQIDQAFEYFKLANDVLRKILPDNHPLIAKSYLGLGYTYFSQRNIVDAKKSFDTAFSIQKQSSIFNHPDFAKIRSARGHCLSTDKHTYKQALHEFEYALNILLEAYPNEHKQHPEILVTKTDLDKLKKGKELRARNTLLDYI